MITTDTHILIDTFKYWIYDHSRKLASICNSRVRWYSPIIVKILCKQLIFLIDFYFMTEKIFDQLKKKFFYVGQTPSSSKRATDELQPVMKRKKYSTSND